MRCGALTSGGNRVVPSAGSGGNSHTATSPLGTASAFFPSFTHAVAAKHSDRAAIAERLSAAPVVRSLRRIDQRLPRHPELVCARDLVRGSRHLDLAGLEPDRSRAQ